MKGRGVLLVLLSFAAVACGGPVEHERLGEEENSLPPGTVLPLPSGTDDGGGTRPSGGGLGAIDVLAEINDPCLRYTCGTSRLRYDRGGVLVSIGADGAVSFIDLDGSSEIMVDGKRENLYVDGRRQSDVGFQLLRSYDSVDWYRLDTPKGAAILVVPKP